MHCIYLLIFFLQLPYETGNNIIQFTNEETEACKDELRTQLVAAETEFKFRESGSKSSCFNLNTTQYASYG